MVMARTGLQMMTVPAPTNPQAGEDSAPNTWKSTADSGNHLIDPSTGLVHNIDRLYQSDPVKSSGGAAGHTNSRSLMAEEMLGEDTRWIWSGLTGKEPRRACSPDAASRQTKHEMSLCGSLTRLRCHDCSVLVCGCGRSPSHPLPFPSTTTTRLAPRARFHFHFQVNFQVKLSSENRK
jgi:hypothetical protein